MPPPLRDAPVRCKWTSLATLFPVTKNSGLSGRPQEARSFYLQVDDGFLLVARTALEALGNAKKKPGPISNASVQRPDRERLVISAPKAIDRVGKMDGSEKSGHFETSVHVSTKPTCGVKVDGTIPSSSKG